MLVVGTVPRLVTGVKKPPLLPISTSTLFPNGRTRTASWPSSEMFSSLPAINSTDADGSAQLGHFDRQGGGTNPTSWNSAHASRGCGQVQLQATGGNGFFYCFGLP